VSEAITNLWSIPLLVIIPIITAILLNLLYRRGRAIKILAVASSAAIFVIALISPYGFQWFTGQPGVTLGGTYTFDASVFSWRLALEYYFGSLQQILIVIMSLLLIFVVFLSTSSIKKNIGPYLGLLFLLFMSAAIIIMVNDFYHLWIAVEIGSLLVAGVVAASGESISQKAALKYTFFSALSGAGMAIALALILGVTGYSNISNAIMSIRMNDLTSMYGVLYIAFAFLLLSWIYAGGLAPLHPLKSDVYGSAYPHATVLLQTQSKLMIVAMGLIILRLFGTLPFAKEVMITVSVLTMILGIVMALVQTDFRWTLAYLIVSHSGLVTLGISLGTVEGITGGLFQAINDVIYMSVLLICCEAVVYFGRGTSIKSAGGLAKRAPILAFAVVIGAFAASGIPPLNGFQSEIILIQASLSSGLPEVAVMVLMVSVATFIALFKPIYNIFLKPEPSPALMVDSGGAGIAGMALGEQVDPIPRSLYIFLAILIALIIILGVVPQLAINFVQNTAIKVVYFPWVP